MSSHPARHTVTGPPPRSAAHAARPPMPARRVAGMLAAGAVLFGSFGLGLWALLGSAGPTTSTPTSASLITVTPSRHP